jgi:hypothetical protein
MKIKSEDYSDLQWQKNQLIGQNSQLANLPKMFYNYDPICKLQR